MTAIGTTTAITAGQRFRLLNGITVTMAPSRYDGPTNYRSGPAHDTRVRFRMTARLSPWGNRCAAGG